MSGLTWCALAPAPRARAATFAELPFALLHWASPASCRAPATAATPVDTSALQAAVTRIAAGAEVLKTPFQRSKWGGVVADGLAGQFDPCYHLDCDSAGRHSDAVAHPVLTFAQTTSSTNGTGRASSNATKSYGWKGDNRVE